HANPPATMRMDCDCGGSLEANASLVAEVSSILIGTEGKSARRARRVHEASTRRDPPLAEAAIRAMCVRVRTSGTLRRKVPLQGEVTRRRGEQRSYYEEVVL